MDEIKKIGDNDLEDISAGILHPGTCFRCGDVDSLVDEYCHHKWYGKPCCDKCFNILSKREEEDYKNGNQKIIKQNDELSKQLKTLIEKINNSNSNNNNKNKW